MEMEAAKSKNSSASGFRNHDLTLAQFIRENKDAGPKILNSIVS